MILREVGKKSKKEKRNEGVAVPWIYSSLNHAVARLSKKIDGVPPHFTLRHDPEECEAVFRKDHAQTTT
ncbi:hypothetical protein GCM10007857_73650 [Bradyrhizobium iriomotense]|uniref:Uncharacterized protein n=2 Tax=Bradyrhizobium iriomotense TaxID=441950 RepID=A0ABQ6B8F0_9BRAD|nr:hypothetical protein GCM10007857_73650 [Bradyrhizobium iriomotense]